MLKSTYMKLRKLTKFILWCCIYSFAISCNDSITVELRERYVSVNQSSLKVKGASELGNILRTNYDELGVLESSKLKIRWYRASDSLGTSSVEILGEIGKTYGLQNEDFGHYIYYTVEYEESEGIFQKVVSPMSSIISSSFTELITGHQEEQGIYNYRFSPNGTKVFYVSSLMGMMTSDLFVYDLETKKTELLSLMLYDDIFGTPSGGLESEIEVSPDSTKVMWAQESDGMTMTQKLFVNDLGTGEVTVISTTNSSQFYDYQFSSDSSEVFYLSDELSPGTKQLLKKAINGGPAIIINDTLVVSGSVSSFKISPIDNKIIYSAAQDTAGVYELYAIGQNGGASVKLNSPFVANGDIRSFSVSNNGARVIYSADQESDDVLELYSVDIAGAAVVKLSTALPNGGDILSFKVSSDSQFVVFQADQVTNDVLELFSVPILGGAAVKLNEALAIDRDVFNYEISPDSNTVIYTADLNVDGDTELFSVPILGGASINLNEALVMGGDVSSYQMNFTADSSTVYFSGDIDIDGVFKLYSNTVNAGNLQVVGNALTSGQNIGQSILDQNEERILATTHSGSATYLKIINIANGVVERIDTPQNSNNQFSMMSERGVVSSDSQFIVFTEVDQLNEKMRIISKNIITGTRTQLSPDLLMVWSYNAITISPDSSHVFYTAEQDTVGVKELYSVNINGGAVTKLNSAMVSGGGVSSVFVSPDSSKVIYIADQDTDNVSELYSVSAAGGAATKLNSALVTGGDVSNSVQVSPDSSQVVYLADQITDGKSELFSVAIGGGGVTKLNSALVSGGYIFKYSISANSSSVIYLADQDTDTVAELYIVPLTGGAVVKLNGALPAGGSISSFLLEKNSAKVIYLADQDTDNIMELYSVNYDGTSVVKLNGALALNGDVSYNFQLSNDSTKVIYLADQDTDNVYELYTVDIGGGALTKVSGALVANGNVNDFKISPLLDKILYRADQDIENVENVFTVNLDGSGNQKVSESTSTGAFLGDAFIINTNNIVFSLYDPVSNGYKIYNSNISIGGNITELGIPGEYLMLSEMRFLSGSDQVLINGSNSSTHALSSLFIDVSGF